MMAEGKTERRPVRANGRCEIGLIIFLEFILVRNVAAVAIHFPTFWKGAQRNPGIILNDDVTVLHEKIAHTGESIAVHQEGSGLEQAESRPARGTPANKRADFAVYVSFAIRNCLWLFAPAEGD